MRKLRITMKTVFILPLTILLGVYTPGKKQRQRLTQVYDSCRICITQTNKLPADDAQCAYLEIEIGNQLSNDYMILQGNIDLARSMSAMGKYDFALEYAHRALEMSRKLKSESQNAELNRLIGAVYTSLDNNRRAEQYLEKARQYYTEQKDTFNLLKTMGTIAINYGQAEDYDTSADYFNEIYWLSQKVNNPTLMLVTLLNLSKVHQLSGQTDKGLLTLERIQMEIPDSVFTTDYRIAYYLNKGELLLEKEQYREAEWCFQNGLQSKNPEKMSLDTRISLLRGLAQIALNNQDFQTSAHYYNHVIQLNDSLENDDTHQRAQEMELIYNLTQQDKKFEALQRIVFRNRILFTFSLCLLTALGIYLYRRIKRKMDSGRKNMEELNLKLQQKRKELTDLAIYYYEMKNKMAAATEELHRLAGQIPTDKDKKEVKRICQQLNESFTDNSKSPIYDYIDANYRDFIQRLSEKYPDLQVSEKRICAMLLIDFSTKDIASVLNISERSINNIRSKIRKKLGIEENISISLFLKNI